jgi:single-stranded-DNA-specific exonuclease
MGEVELLERELGVSFPVAQVLVRRGLADPARARVWLAAQERHPPGAFRGIDEAGAAILRHVAAGSRITVHGDYDVDGVCSTAVLVTALRRLDANVDWYLPGRLVDGYGLQARTVERLAARGTRLLLTVDCGITAVAEVAAARAAGLDVVITDHHAPRADGLLPEAPVVHPAVCGYPCVDLCATAVAHKLAAHLQEAAGGDPDRADDELDLVALATVADVVALRGENRRLVRSGLRALNATARPGLRALMRVAQVTPGAIDARTIAFRLAPRINAAGRMHRADAGLELLLTSDDARAAQIAEELDAANAERRHVETRILFEAEGQVAAAGDHPAYVLAGEGWHPGVIGIVAARIAERHHRPTVLLALEDAAPADGPTPAGGAAPKRRRATGSARSIPAYDLLAGLDAAAEHLLRHGGHRAAAGLELEVDRIDAFRGAFTAHAARALTAEDLRPIERVDAVVSGGELGTSLAEELAGLAPFGAANPEVCLLLPAATLSDPVAMGEGKHVRFTVQSGGARARAVAFGTGGRIPVPDPGPVDATFSLELNEYRGTVEPRLLLRHVLPSTPEAPELVGEPEPYLQAVWHELGAPLESTALGRGGPAKDGRIRDRRGMGIAGTVGALVATGEPVLVACADARRRREHMRGRLGGFGLCSYAALDRDPSLATPYAHLVALDPPWCLGLVPGCAAGQMTYLAWGEAELGFAMRVHDHQYGLRPWLAALYRALRATGGAEGDGLETVLRGDGSPARSPAMVGRVLRVLQELDLVEVDRERRRVTVPAAQRTALERSAAFRAYERRHQEGHRYLRQMTPRAA